MSDEKSRKTNPQRKNWFCTPQVWWFFSFGVILLIISSLLFTRVKSINIALEATVSEVGFTLESEQLFLGGVPFPRMRISGLKKLTFSEAGNQFQEPIEVKNKSFTLELVASNESGEGSLSLEDMDLSANTQVRLRSIDKYESSKFQHQIILGKEDSEAGIQGVPNITIKGPIGVALKPKDVGKVPNNPNFKTTTSVELESFEGELLAISLPTLALSNEEVETNELSIIRIAPQILIKDISFQKLRDKRPTSSDFSSNVSTIIDGKIFLESLDGREIPLRNREKLRFRKLEGELLDIELNKDHIKLYFTGRVWGMAIGSTERPRNLMPSNLDRLLSHRSWKLFWGTVVALVIFLGAIKNLWR